MLPKVSIYILNYNYGKFIGQAIESCVDQSFQNIEIIIIDDGCKKIPIYKNSI